jgi:hypothetical protein
LLAGRADMGNPGHSAPIRGFLLVVTGAVVLVFGMNSSHSCPDCAGEGSLFSRRSFLKSASASGLALAGGLPLLRGADAAKSAPDSETLVAQLFKSLNDEQKNKVCFEFDHPLRSKVDNNWQIVSHTIAGTFNKDQQDLIRQIFRGIHSEEYAEKVYGQVVHDSEGEGFENSCAVAMFGQPGSGKFEWVLTGRHCTRRCDGDSVDGAAFGGPIFYGHAAESFNEGPEHKGNVYWHQALRANEVFKALDGRQQERALCAEGRPEKHSDTVKLTGKKDGLDGIAFSDLTKDQQGLVEKVLADLLAPFRKKDAAEAMKFIKESGMDSLHMAFYKKGDIGSDKVWDVWQIEGPDMVWYFRGAPHVHCWANIRKPGATPAA